jgi:sulfonate transport system substrate-binding protein
MAGPAEGRVPAIHVFLSVLTRDAFAWMAGTSPAMTTSHAGPQGACRYSRARRIQYRVSVTVSTIATVDTEQPGGNMMRNGVASCVLAASAVLLAFAPAAAEPVKLKVGWVVAGADAPFQLFGPKGVAKHEGVTYTLEGVHFNGTPTMITALATGDIDLAPLAYSSFPLAVENAKMDDLRVISDVFQDGVPDYYSNEFMVLKDGPIKTLADLKGTVVATNLAGSAVDVAMRAMLAQHGINPKSDVTIIEIPFPNQKPQLLEKKVTLIAAVRPFSADPQLRSLARTLFTQQEAIGRSQMIIMTGRAPVLAKNRAAIIDFLEDHIREVRWFTDPANHDEAVKRLADFTKQPVERFASWAFTKQGDFFHDPAGVPDLKALQANITLTNKLGFIPAPLDLQKYADLSLIDAAGARLK